MSRTPLTATQQADADRIYEALRSSLDSDMRQIAELLASKPDGQLLGAPHMDEAGFSRSDYPLHAVQTAVWDGHLFLHMGNAPQPLARQLGDLPEKFAVRIHYFPKLQTITVPVDVETGLSP